MSLVSVVIPVYNVKDYLGICLDSVLKQSYRNIQIILVDDGSTDESGMICEQYARLDDRVEVLHQANQGLVSARKLGFSVAKGDYSLIVDSDDWIEPNMVEKLLHFIKKCECDIVQCNWTREYGGVSKSEYCLTDSEEIILADNRQILLEDWMAGKSNLGSQVVNKIYKTSLLKNIYAQVPNNMSVGEDLIFFINIIFSSSVRSIFVINDNLYHYRIREDSLSNNLTNLKFISLDVLLTDYLCSMIKTFCPSITGNIMDVWLLNRKIRSIKGLLNKKCNIYTKYFFPNMCFLKGKKILLYGAGKVGQDFFEQISHFDDVEIVAWVDRNYQDIKYKFFNVKSINAISKYSYDYIVIAIGSENIVKEIKFALTSQYDVSSEAILWEIASKQKICFELC